MIRKSQTWAKAFALLFLVLSGENGYTNNLESQEQALDIIEEFADRFCKTVPLEGQSEKLTLSGQAKAELGTVLKKFADLGIEGAGRYQNSEFRGVLQNQLAEALKDNLVCRNQVLKDLKDKLLPESPPLAELLSTKVDELTKSADKTREKLQEVLAILERLDNRATLENPQIREVIEHARKTIADTLTIRFSYNDAGHQYIGLADEAEAYFGEFLVANARLVDVHFTPRPDGTQLANSIEVEETHLAPGGVIVYQGRLFFPMPFGGIMREVGISGRKTLQVFSRWSG